MRPEAKLSMKNDYAFSFRELGDNHGEYELAHVILRKIEEFLREMGNVYSLLDDTVRLEVEKHLSVLQEQCSGSRKKYSEYSA